MAVSHFFALRVMLVVALGEQGRIRDGQETFDISCFLQLVLDGPPSNASGVVETDGDKPLAMSTLAHRTTATDPESPDFELNVALQKPTFFDDQGLHPVSGGSVAGLTDGLYANNSWGACPHTKDWSKDPFVGIDLESSETVCGFRVRSSAAYTLAWSSGAILAMSDTKFVDNVAFTAALGTSAVSTCAVVSSSGWETEPYAWQSLPCSSAVSGRYAYLRYTGSSGRFPGSSNQVAVCDMEVLGCIGAIDPGSGPADQSSVVGDPHAINVAQARFEIRSAGVHKLVQIPQFIQHSSKADLRVDADIQHLESSDCSKSFMTSLSIVGQWTENRFGQMHISQGSNRPNTTLLINTQDPESFFNQFPLPNVKAGHSSIMFNVNSVGFHVRKHFEGRYGKQQAYLNVRITGLKKFTDLGGLLGYDDHTGAERLDANCTVAQTPPANQSSFIGNEQSAPNMGGGSRIEAE